MPSGDVYRVNNIGQSTDPWDTPKDIFRYDYRVPLITADCLRWLKQDLNQSSAAFLIPNSCSRCSNIVLSIVSNAADKSSRMRTTPLNVSIAVRRSFCTLSRAVSVLWFCFMHSAELHGAHSEQGVVLASPSRHVQWFSINRRDWRQRRSFFKTSGSNNTFFSSGVVRASFN